MPSSRFPRSALGALSLALAGSGLVAVLPSSASAWSATPVSAPAKPVPGSVLISEIANGGGGADSSKDRVSNDDFMEIGNFGTDPVDISGWRLMRCGQTGDAYGPQKVFPAGTLLQPGEKYTVGSASSAHQDAVKRDSDYDETGSTLHSFGFGAYLETPDYDLVDRVGFYAPTVDTDCAAPDDPAQQALARPLDHRLNESHQRVSNTGDDRVDFVVAPRTPDAENVTQGRDNRADSTVRISEVAPGASGTGNDSDQYVELTNYGTEPVDVTGWKLYRCGENASTYLQNGALPDGVIEPGASYLIAHQGATAAMLDGHEPNARYATGMHWRDFGALLTTDRDAIVDSVGFYGNRNSICTDGASVTAEADALQNESYHRIADTGDNAADFMLARERTPAVASVKSALSAPAPFERGPLRFSEIVGAGPAGGADEFVELGNYGESPIDLSGYSLTRCEGTGKGNAGTQVADLGAVILAPGETYLAVDDSAPSALRALADAEYATGMNEVDGYGMYLRDPEGRVVDKVGVYEGTTYSPCVLGAEIRNYTKNDLGESYQRARTTDDNEEDFAKTSGRTPGELAEVAWVDPTEPLRGELDPVRLDQRYRPEQPKATGRMTPEGFRTEVRTEDRGDAPVQVELRTGTLLDTEGTTVFAGSTQRALPKTLKIVGERKVATAPELLTRTGGSSYPFQRFAIPAAQLPNDGAEFTWTGTTRPNNEIQVYGWTTAAGDSDESGWRLLTAGTAGADGGLSLVAPVDTSSVTDDVLNVLVIDAPRTQDGLTDEIGVTDQAFADPDQYDWSMNQMSDTQFLSEGFRDVFRQQASWVVANADARKIGYSTNTGDIVENWIGGNADPVRARKEFAAARRIHDLLNDADVPNGVLPGNHDNLWGRNNDLYNEYFGPDAFDDKAWWGDSFGPKDNSAHYDFVTENGIEFLILSLPYRPSQAQIEWAREVAGNYPKHNVVLLTHSYLTTEKEIENRSDRYTARGEDIWTDLVSPSNNIFLVLGGHYHGVATKYGDPVTGEHSDAIEIAADTTAVRNVGETHRTVVQMLADYQGYRSTQPTPRADTLDRDTGFQRLLQFDLDGELMGVNAYSPHLNSFEAYKYDEPGHRGTVDNDWKDGRYQAVDDEFVAKVDLLIDKDLATAGWGLNTTSSPAGTASAAPGAAATVTLPDVDAETVWYASIEDADGYRALSAPQLATTDGEVPGATATTTEVTRSAASQQVGATGDRAVMLFASVTAEDDPTEKNADGGSIADTPEITATGTVEFTAGSHRLGSTQVRNGSASLRVPASLPVGQHRVVARFVPGSAEELRGSTSAPVAVTVRKVVTRITAKTPKTAKPQRPFSVKVIVKPFDSSLPVTGRATVEAIRDGMKKARTVTLTQGRGTATFKLPKGSHRIVVRYRGSATMEAGKFTGVRVRVG